MQALKPTRISPLLNKAGRSSRLLSASTASKGPSGTGILRPSPTLRAPATSTSQTSTTSPTSAAPFAFLPSNTLPAKPRSRGLTEIRGPYYAPVTATYLDELLSDWGEYVDGVKFAGGSFTLMPPERLSKLIEVAHKHGKSLSQVLGRG